MKKIIQCLQTSGVREAMFITCALEEEATLTTAPPARPTQPEDPNNPGQFLPNDSTELAIWEEEIKMTARRHEI